MSGVLEITRKFTLLGKLMHYLFECPTFWRRKPAFEIRLQLQVDRLEV